MKIAIVHDHLTCRAGGEQVALAFHKAFPDAPIYTLAYNPEGTFPEFKSCDIRTSWFQHISKQERNVKRLFFPLGIMAMRSIYLDEYDVVLISGTHCGKYVRFSTKTIVVTYCYTPFRLAWNPESYSEYANATGLKKLIFKMVIQTLQLLDKKYAERTDFFLAMTQETKQRIKSVYNPKNEVEVINPPVNNLSSYHISTKSKEYYLIVSRLEFYKKVDLAINVFNKLNTRLIVVGKGSKEVELKKIANPSKIIFKKNISNGDLADLYSNCKAFIFPQYEDYGLTALEANAAGRPVIAFNRGGILDTQIPYNGSNQNATSILFNEQTEKSLEDAINKFESIDTMFNSLFIRKHAELFSEDMFIDKIRKFINSKKKL
jgi:glycosyltransferase involved in cell wall biosynthesis